MRQNPFEKYLTKENKFQRAVAQWLNMQHGELLWWHTPNEGKRSTFERWLAKVLGIRAGVSDIIIVHQNAVYNGIAMELKVGNNKPTQAQQDFLQHAKRQGFYTCVCYDLQQVMQVVNNYMQDVAQLK